MAQDPAVSSVHGNLLMVAIAVILAFLVLLLVLGMLSGLWGSQSLAPPLIQITDVFHTEKGKMNLASRIAIMNRHCVEYRNRDLKAVFFRNGEELFARINTLNGHNFIPTQHFGVSTIGGAGCSNDFFSPGEKILIDLKNGYYRPGDRIELRIYQRSTDTRPAPITGDLTDQAYMSTWLDEHIYSEKSGYRLISQHQVLG